MKLLGAILLLTSCATSDPVLYESCDEQLAKVRRQCISTLRTCQAKLMICEEPE